MDINLTKIDKTAKIGKNVKIGAFSSIGANVEIGDNTKIGSHVVIEGPCFIGKNCNIFQYAAIGAIPQDLKYQGEKTIVRIGDNTTIREFATIHKGTVQDKGETIIGNNCLIMNYVHVAHDCIIGNNVILSNSVGLCGHVKIDDFAIVSGMVGVMQFLHIGAHSFIAGDTSVHKNVPPFVIAHGDKAKGINKVGIARNNYTPTEQQDIKTAYKILYKQNLLKKEAKEKLGQLAQNSSVIKMIYDFLNLKITSEKGIVS